MSIDQLTKSLKSLRLSGMAGTLEIRAQQVDSAQMNFVEGLSWLVQDELDRRQSKLLDRRFSASGLTQRKTLKEFDWSFNSTPPRREILELATLKFIDSREDALFLGKPGTGKSHIAKAIALQAVERGYKVAFRPAHDLFEELHEARQLGTIKKCRLPLVNAQLLVIDDLFLRKLPQGAADELADVLMSRYERASTIITSNRPIEDWSKLLGDVVIVTPLLDRLMHHGYLFRFDGKSWRLKEAAERNARLAIDETPQD
jgi:DNA replication protein DnaC